MSEPYKTCPDCGAHLDPCEICDCRKKDEKRKVATFVATLMSGPKSTPDPHVRHNDLQRHPTIFNLV